MIYKFIKKAWEVDKIMEIKISVSLSTTGELEIELGLLHKYLRKSKTNTNRKIRGKYLI